MWEESVTEATNKKSDPRPIMSQIRYAYNKHISPHLNKSEQLSDLN